MRHAHYGILVLQHRCSIICYSKVSHISVSYKARWLIIPSCVSYLSGIKLNLLLGLPSKLETIGAGQAVGLVTSRLSINSRLGYFHLIVHPPTDDKISRPDTFNVANRLLDYNRMQVYALECWAAVELTDSFNYPLGQWSLPPGHDEIGHCAPQDSASLDHPLGQTNHVIHRGCMHI